VLYWSGSARKFDSSENYLLIHSGLTLIKQQVRYPILFTIIFILGFLIFSNSLSGEFIYDDYLVLSHSLFSQPLKFFKFFNEPYFEDFVKAGLYRPLTQISFALNFLFGSSPTSFHVINVLLHIVNSILIFILLIKLKFNVRLSSIVSFLFLILPIHIEAVSSIVGRAELLVFFFSILSIILFLDSKYITSTLFFFLALLSKETAIVLPAILLAISVVFRLRKFDLIKLFSGWIIFGLIYLILRIRVLGQYAFKVEKEFVFNPLAFIPFGERIATSLKILMLYIQKAFLPINLSSDYSYNQIPLVKNIFSSLWSFLGLLVLIFLFFTLINLFKKLKTNNENIKFNLFFAVLTFLLPYLVISNLIYPIGSIMADRFMYMPSLGLVIFLALFLNWLIKTQKKLGYIFLFTIIVFYSILTICQNKVWANEYVFFREMYERSPNSIVAKTNWAKIVPDRQKAKRLLYESYNLYSDFVPTLNALAVVEKDEGNLKQAEELLEKSIKIMPNNQDTLIKLSRVYFMNGDYRRADRVLEKLVLNYDGTGNTILYALNKIMLGKYNAAVRIIKEYFGEDTNNESAKIVLAYAYLKSGNFSEVRKSGFNLTELEKEFTKLKSIFHNF